VRGEQGLGVARAIYLRAATGPNQPPSTGMMVPARSRRARGRNTVAGAAEIVRLAQEGGGNPREDFRVVRVSMVRRRFVVVWSH